MKPDLMFGVLFSWVRIAGLASTCSMVEPALDEVSAASTLPHWGRTLRDYKKNIKLALSAAPASGRESQVCKTRRRIASIKTLRLRGAIIFEGSHFLYESICESVCEMSGKTAMCLPLRPQLKAANTFFFLSAPQSLSVCFHSGPGNSGSEGADIKALKLPKIIQKTSAERWDKQIVAALPPDAEACLCLCLGRSGRSYR